ncbi:hypothetical protein N9M39_01290 [Halieaceae bacterium]|nr:hypothetical protein [Halieaceae bacterium]
MADDVSISYSFQTGPTAAAGPDPTLIAYTNCEHVDLGNGGMLLINRNNGKQTIVAPEVATALTYCTHFRTLREHADVLTRSIPQLQGQLENVIQVLTSVRDAGMMLTADDVLARINSVTDASDRAPTRVFIITCDRPAAVNRLLDSLLRAGSLSNHDQLVLVDDSRQAANQAENREAVARFNLSAARSMLYVGAEAQATLLTGLVQRLPDQEAGIRFLIDRERWANQPSYGLARNICLLLSVGYRAIVLDDDILCQAVRSPMKEPGLAFGSIKDRPAFFFGSEQELMQNAVDAGVNPLSGHADVLGLPLHEAVSKLQHNTVTSDQLRGANAAFLNTLSAGSPVLVTQCGSWGDPGVGNGHWVLYLDPYSIGRMLDAPGGLSGAIQNRLCGLNFSRPTISKAAVMSQMTGLDNSQLLPPYFPAFRGEDALFASMVTWLHPDSAVVNCDWAVPHLPLEQREERGARAPIAAQGGLGTLARYLSDQVDFRSGASAETRLASLTSHFRTYAESTDGALEQAFRAELAREHAAQLQVISRQMQLAPQLESQNWQAYLQRALDEVNQAMATAHSLGELAAGSEPDGFADLILRAGSEFADALAGWVAVREVSKLAADALMNSGTLAP